MSIIEEYWAGVHQRLEAEAHVFAQLVAHEGERGRENEAVLARILEALVPRRYGLGSGLLIDTANQYSRQTDIIVYDQSDEPAVLAQTTQLLFPVESVLACVEVKTTLRGPDVQDCLDKAAHMRTKLNAARRYPDGADHPLFVLLAYRAGQEPATIVRKLMDADENQRPDLVCVVEQGILAGADASIRRGSTAPLDAGLALLLEDDEPVKGEPTGPTMRQEHRGRPYPIVRYGEKLLLVQPSRALLLFVDAIVRRLADRQKQRPPVLSYYVDAHMRTLAWYGSDGRPVT